MGVQFYCSRKHSVRHQRRKQIKINQLKEIIISYSTAKKNYLKTIIICLNLETVFEIKQQH